MVQNYGVIEINATVANIVQRIEIVQINITLRKKADNRRSSEIRLRRE